MDGINFEPKGIMTDRILYTLMLDGDVQANVQGKGDFLRMVAANIMSKLLMNATEDGQKERILDQFMREAMFFAVMPEEMHGMIWDTLKPRKPEDGIAPEDL